MRSGEISGLVSFTRADQGGTSDDQETYIGSVPFVLAKERPEYRQAEKSWDIQHSQCGGKTRERSPILQETLKHTL